MTQPPDDPARKAAEEYAHEVGEHWAGYPVISSAHIENQSMCSFLAGWAECAKQSAEEIERLREESEGWRESERACDHQYDILCAVVGVALGHSNCYCGFCRDLCTKYYDPNISTGLLPGEQRLDEISRLRAQVACLREGLEVYGRNDFIGWLIETQEGRQSDPCKSAREALARAKELGGGG